MSKKWYQSKAILTAVIVGIVAGAQHYGVVIPEWVLTALTGFGLYSLRVGSKTIK